jgi:hypothetical protein
MCSVSTPACSPQRDHQRARPGGAPQQLQEGAPEPGSVHRATVRNVRPFGVFVELQGYRRHGLVHNSQVSEDIAFSREDEDEAKVKAMEFFAPLGSQVWRWHTPCRAAQHACMQLGCLVSCMRRALRMHGAACMRAEEPCGFAGACASNGHSRHADEPCLCMRRALLVAC